MAETIGDIQVVASINTKSYDSSKKKIKDGNQELESSANKTSKGFSSAWIGAIAGVAASLTNTFLGAIKSSVGGAIKRVDTLNNSSRTFANMGFAAKDTADTMKLLEKSIKGLPTSLDSAVSGVQLLAGATGDIKQAQQIFAAINDGVLGFGGNSEQVSGAVRQLSQDLAGGVLTAETWNSLLDNGLGPTLNAIAKQMGKTSKELKAGLSDGSVSVEDFTKKLIKMDKEGGGGMASLQKIVKDSTSGISTGISNAETAVTRGVANIIKAIGAETISATITTVGAVFEQTLTGLSGAFIILKNNIAIVTQFLQPLLNYITQNKQVMEVLKTTLIVIGAILGGAVLAGIILVTVAATALVATIEFLIGTFTWLGTTAAGVWKSISKFAVATWNTIKTTFSGVGVWFGQVFGGAYKAMVKSFSGTYDYFKGLFNTIIAAFGKVGSAIGNTIGGAFKGVINGIIKFVESTVNGIITSINNVAEGIDKALPGDQSGWRVPKVSLPQLASGGVVTAPTVAMIGEGRESEAVLPLSKLDSLLDNDGGDTNSSVSITVNLSGIMTRSRSDTRAVAKDLIEAVNEELRAKSQPEIGGGVLRGGMA